jgi:tyrosyl-tRNA synthetase
MNDTEQLALLTRGAVDLVQKDDLDHRLRAGRPLRVKAGFDPTRPDLHLGHIVLLTKMRQFQDAGHTVIFLIGDYTAMVGDPTGRNELRPRLTREEVLASATTYKEQAFKALDESKLEIRYNSEWLSKLGAMDFIDLAAKVTVARMLERDDFQKRFAQHHPIYQHEFLYPLLQAYDSVALDCDIELGGADQLFNLMMGRDIMPRYGKPAQIVMTVPLLEGLDAKMVGGAIVGKKMSKSSDNYIGITESPVDMFRKCMQIDDSIIWRYFELLSSRPAADLATWKGEVAAGKSPLEIKALFATEIITRFHSAADAATAQREFQATYMGGDVPDQIQEIRVRTDGPDLWIAKALSLAGLVSTTSDGKRLVEQGGIEIDGERIKDSQHRLARGKSYVVRAGSKKRRFAKIIVEE